MFAYDYNYFYTCYQRGTWTREMLWNIVKINKLTEEEYEMITGEKYPEVCPPSEPQGIKPKQ